MSYFIIILVPTTEGYTNIQICRRTNYRSQSKLSQPLNPPPPIFWFRVINKISDEV